jgi:site-specific DNA-methyltransferase (adenine-specific)
MSPPSAANIAENNIANIIKNTPIISPVPNIAKDKFQFIPLQDFSHPWTDEMLYEKYGLEDDEIAFIESMIRPME